MGEQVLTALERKGLVEVLPAGETGDRAVARIAGEQLGVISRGQALALGFTRDSIDHRLSRCSWRHAHRGVYTVCPVGLVEWADEMAAVLAIGEGVLLTANSALVAHRLASDRPTAPEVLVQGRNPNPRDGIVIHRASLLDRRETRWFKGIPVVSPALALLDSAADLKPRALEQAVATGYRKNVVRRSELEGVIERLPGRRGIAALREVLAWEAGPAFTRSQLEELGLALIRGARLPHCDVNHPRGNYSEVDLVWPDHRFILELDGHAFHSLRPDRERDYRRDNEHQHAGFHVARATGRQLRDEPGYVIAVIVRGLERPNR